MDIIEWSRWWWSLSPAEKDQWVIDRASDKRKAKEMLNAYKT